MKKGLTELVFILDKSGSMSGMEEDTIGGFNSMLNKQKNIDGDCHITTVLFDNNYYLLHDRIDIKAVNKMTRKEYTIGGSTALVDAIGKAIHKISNVQKQTGSMYQAENVMMIIITDGQENSSREYSLVEIKQLIEIHKNEYNWEFIFLGANIDAITTASRFGIKASRASNFINDSDGIALNFDMIENMVSAFRCNSMVDEEYLEEIRRDNYERKNIPK